ncbi:hypothetical protein KIN20_022172 [Parelaphostrongylus tenuis]|uniref:Uncharacterized protein n=1 Tax=Parelaphostrongylus tenuis TaxID=148309 RepID=A0AAD5N5C8_PARTN|nr:hypothetical protein KIN20_022172 [Parelaphostrongylus tenuis]
MDEDEFPFEDHDLGSLNGLAWQDEDENGYDDDYSEDSNDVHLPNQKAESRDVENNPGMSVSAGQDDNQGMRDVSLNDLCDKFLEEAETGSVDGLRNMLAECPDLLSGFDEDGYMVLHRAARYNNLEALSFLLENGADPNARTRDEWTPLHLAAHWGNHRIVERLISQGVDVNARHKFSMTALHLAVCSPTVRDENVLQVIRHLLGAPGIDVSAHNVSGYTPMDLARGTSEAIYMLLKEHLDR